ncbi:MAG: 4'-phosphopantetheinyl transferase superfamily protein [Hyphomonas sp.]|nr:4'-phosphopantetheinyl transferase superfamily protein [Hyphomonas sp.]
MSDLPAIPLFGTPAPVAGAEGCWVWHSGPGTPDVGLLTPEEAARVAALVDETRRAHLARHLGERRQLLSAMLGRPVDGVAIGHDGEGRPFLPFDEALSISLAGAGGWNALALSRTGRVGIDLEPVRSIDWKPMLGMTSDLQEREMVEEIISADDTLAPFFRLWTLKEAVLKAAGSGLRGGAKRVCLPMDLIDDSESRGTAIHDGVRYEIRCQAIQDVVVSMAVRA